MSSTLFQPRRINPELYIDASPVNVEESEYKCTYVSYKKIESVKDFMKFIKDMYDMKNNFLKIHNLTVINKEGMINPLEKWVINAYYNYK